MLAKDTVGGIKIGQCVIAARKCTVGDLIPGRKYLLSVKAFISEDTSICGAFSTETISYTIPQSKYSLIVTEPKTSIIDHISFVEPSQLAIEGNRGVTEMTVTCARNSHDDRQADALSYFAKVTTANGQAVGASRTCTRSPNSKVTCPIVGLQGCSKYTITIIACPTNKDNFLCSPASDPIKSRTVPGGNYRFFVRSNCFCCHSTTVWKIFRRDGKILQCVMGATGRQWTD